MSQYLVWWQQDSRPYLKAEMVAAWKSRAWGHLDFITDGGGIRDDSSMLFSFIVSPFQTVQRAELWGLILALQTLLLLLFAVIF